MPAACALEGAGFVPGAVSAPGAWPAASAVTHASPRAPSASRGAEAPAHLAPFHLQPGAAEQHLPTPRPRGLQPRAARAERPRRWPGCGRGCARGVGRRQLAAGKPYGAQQFNKGVSGEPGSGRWRELGESFRREGRRRCLQEQLDPVSPELGRGQAEACHPARGHRVAS
ncbi:Hypothetical predicted protein [Marmota monax]|uniref:Uncharacterized protein n=1 Tax=Marmota monax TaxID=9995 RepID=A0A5E4AF41_MARMO|nr:hypothetical protein GHT09_002621 [Marmota monax]VTJ55904.1 Hypothetical predicted protein [Marmota monax]